MNSNNLIPNSMRSPSELRRNGQKGGLESGKSRKAKKETLKIFSAFLDSKADDNAAIKEIAKELNLSTDKSIKEVIVFKYLINSLKRGNLSDLKLLSELLGESSSNDSISENMLVLADIICRPQSNRNIANFEEKGLDNE